MTEQQGTGGRRNGRRVREARTITKNRRSASSMTVAAHEALQEALDGLIQDLRFTQSMVDALEQGSGDGRYWRDTMFGRIPNEWIRARDGYRDELARVALSIEAKGLAERNVRVQEAQAVMMAQMIREAAERAGLKPDQVRALGDELRQLSREVTQ